jgi:hypothetical protein
MVDTTTGSNSIFNPGDTFQVTITGASPNQPIVVQSQIDGVPQPAVSYGSTDATGSATITGTIPANGGQWWEQWTVGGVAVGTISFQVPGVSTTTTSTGGDFTAGSGISSITDMLAAPISIFGFSVPVWGIAAAGVGALMFFGGGKKGRRR